MQCIAAVRKGYSPSLRHLGRTERIALGTAHEQFECGQPDFIMKHQESEWHKGDIFTKKLVPLKF
eukprot:7566389-Heterocapsa_arctica.AAC.1